MADEPMTNFQSVVRLAQKVDEENAELDRKVFRFDGTFDDLIAYFRAAGISIGPSYEGSHADGSPIKWMMFNPTALEIWRVAGSFWIGTPKALERLAKGPI